MSDTFSGMSDADLQTLHQSLWGINPSGLSDAELQAAHQALPPAHAPQMEGWQREVALPASNIAKGLTSFVGLPGDILRGVGYLGGKQAESQLAGNPIPSGVLEMPTGADQTGNMAWPTTAGGLVPQGNQVMEGRAPIVAPTGHNPIDTESLLGHTQSLGITDRPDLEPQNARERYEAAGAQGLGMAAPLLVTGGLSGSSAVPSVIKGGLQAIGGGLGSQAGADVGGAIGGTPGEIAGSLAGGLIGGRLAPGGKVAGSYLPTRMDKETTDLARAAQEHYDLPISIGQATSSPFIKYLNSWAGRMPFSGSGAFAEKQQETFNRGIGKSFGEDAGKITPEVLDRAQQRIGGVMNGVAARSAVPFDNQIRTDLTNTVNLANTAGLQTGQAEAIARQADNIARIALQNGGTLAPGVNVASLAPGELLAHVTGGTIPGHVYQNLTKRGEALDLLQGNRSTTSGQLGGQIKDALDGGLLRGASPEDVKALREARTQYKALKTVEPLTMRADAVGGATPSTGDISPAALLARVRQQYPTAARQGLGEIPLKDLAQIGQRFLKEPPSSGTSERLGAGGLMHTVTGALAAGGAEAAHGAGLPLHLIVPAAAAGLAGPRIVSGVLRQQALPTSYSPFGFGFLGSYPQITNGGQR